MCEVMNRLEADDLIEQIAAFEAQIKKAEEERDEFIKHYQEKIERAKEICERATVAPRQEIAALTEALRQYAETNLPEGRKSIALPSGVLSFHKQQPKFFFDNQEANSKNKALLDWAKYAAPDCVKFTPFVDWSALKPKLKIDGEDVFFADTGEQVSGLRAEISPDKFTVKMA